MVNATLVIGATFTLAAVGITIVALTSNQKTFIEKHQLAPMSYRVKMDMQYQPTENLPPGIQERSMYQDWLVDLTPNSEFVSITTGDATKGDGQTVTVETSEELSSGTDASGRRLSSGARARATTYESRVPSYEDLLPPADGTSQFSKKFHSECSASKTVASDAVRRSLSELEDDSVASDSKDTSTLLQHEDDLIVMGRVVRVDSNGHLSKLFGFCFEGCAAQIANDCQIGDTVQIGTFGAPSEMAVKENHYVAVSNRRRKLTEAPLQSAEMEPLTMEAVNAMIADPNNEEWQSIELEVDGEMVQVPQKFEAKAVTQATAAWNNERRSTGRTEGEVAEFFNEEPEYAYLPTARLSMCPEKEDLAEDETEEDGEARRKLWSCGPRGCDTEGMLYNILVGGMPLYCGPGTNLTSEACPEGGAWTGTPSDRYTFHKTKGVSWVKSQSLDDLEYRCRRHDHTKKGSSGWLTEEVKAGRLSGSYPNGSLLGLSLPTMSCKADQDLAWGSKTGFIFTDGLGNEDVFDSTCYVGMGCTGVVAAALYNIVPTIGLSLFAIPAACDVEDVVALLFGPESPVYGGIGCYNYENVPTHHYVTRAHGAHNHWCNCGWRGCSWGCPSNHGETYQAFSHTTYSPQHVLKTWLSRYESTKDWGDDAYDVPGPDCGHKNSDGTTAACTQQCPDDEKWSLTQSPWKFAHDGECSVGNQIRMYNGINGDNNGSDLKEKEINCANACLDKKDPLEGSWDGFTAKGFIMMNDGRCWCESAESSTSEEMDENYNEEFSERSGDKETKRLCGSGYCASFLTTSVRMLDRVDGNGNIIRVMDSASILGGSFDRFEKYLEHPMGGEFKDAWECLQREATQSDMDKPESGGLA
ncbi:hypothetical protein ScalyP_jg10122 [Parmales sp. scaly parma]|nr:hypothetical protein ScalyP_jg10122 [Parmales sp. scaly parma]